MAIPQLDSSQPAVQALYVGQQIEIQESDDGGADFQHYIFVDPTATGCDVYDPLYPSYTYVYRIRVVGSSNAGIPLDGFSPYSATVSAQTFCAPPQPVTVTAGATELDFTWTDNNEGETATIFQLATDPGFTNLIQKAKKRCQPQFS